MSDTLRKLVDEVTFLRKQPSSLQRLWPLRDSNPWSPLTRRAASLKERSIGDSTPSRNKPRQSERTERERERGAHTRPPVHNEAQAGPQEGMRLGETMAQRTCQRAP